MAFTLTYPSGGALIVGGTGRVGEGIVRQMAKTDVPLVFTYRGAEGSNGEQKSLELERELQQAGHDVTRLKLDFSDQQAIHDAIGLVVSKTGRIHSVMCAGGPEVPFDRLADLETADLDKFIKLDVLSHYRLYRESVQAMRKTGGGSITVCTTMANTRVFNFLGLSSSAKGAVEAFSKQIAAEEGIHNIRSNAVRIGWVSQDTLESVDAMLPPAPTSPPKGYMEMLSHLLRGHMAKTKIQRIADPEEAGSLFAFLASDQASYITGQSIVFDGGISL